LFTHHATNNELAANFSVDFLEEPFGTKDAYNEVVNQKEGSEFGI
jgi:hypothetical protein